MNARWLTLAVPLALAATIGSAAAQTITVDISDSDVIDVDPYEATVASLPGPDGHVSFAEAMIAASNTPGRQTIAFAIPTSEWTYLSWYYPGRAVVHSVTGFGWQAYDEVTIDGRTQTAFTGDTNPAGWEVVLSGTVHLIADDCTVSGVDSSGVSVSGSHGRVEGNSGPMGIEVIGAGTGGSGTLVKDNQGGGWIQIDRSSDNVVVGNIVQRVRVLGWIAGGEPARNNRIGGPTPAERNFITGVGTLNSQGIPGGFAVQLFDSIDTLVENNWIGTTPDGLQQGHPYTTAGIYLDAENHDAILRGNRIAGILARAVPPHGPSYLVGRGIQLSGTGSGVAITGNTIGLNALNQPVLGSVEGIATYNYYLGPMTGVVIGGSAPGEGNEIAGQRATAITVANSLQGVRISGNSIHDNGGLGIDLVTDLLAQGVTPNDPLDADTGGNGLQNFPVLQSANIAGSSIHVVGTLNSTPSTSFQVELFASPQCDPSGFGEGQDFLGRTTVTTDASGNASFDIALVAAVPPGSFLSATCTNAASGSTSEFSACMPVTGSTAQWGSLGMGLAGGSGVPQLSGSGAPILGTPVTMLASGARPFAPIWFVGGLSQVRRPFVGGILVPAPDFVIGRMTNGAGTASFTGQLSQPLAAGQEMTVQAWILDPAGLRGWAASNAIATLTP